MNVFAKTIIHLSLLKGIGAATIQKIVAAFQSTEIEKIYTYNVGDIVKYIGIGKTQAQRIVSGLKDFSILEQELSLAYKYNITIVTLYCNVYPELLRHIYMPPPVLYIKGHMINSAAKKISIVGSRDADKYGAEVVNFLLPSLIEQDIQIVSGGAYGIDTIAHKVALKNKGITVAVLGSGLLRPYPQSNKMLFEEIAQTGSLVSTFSLTTSPLPGNFPARNRVISGLCQATLVVQAAQKSGALITARYALDQGRDVFTIPGSIFNKLSVGCHSLLSEGAIPVYSVDKLLQDLGEPVSKPLKNGILNKENAGSQNVIFQKEKFVLTDKEKVLRYASNAISFDELCSKLNISSVSLQDLLFDLQLENKIEQDISGLWKIC